MIGLIKSPPRTRQPASLESLADGELRAVVAYHSGDELVHTKPGVTPNVKRYLAPYGKSPSNYPGDKAIFDKWKSRPKLA